MGFMGVLAFLGALMIIWVILGIIAYILMAVGLYMMAKKQAIQYDWLAFIPIAQMYILGKLIKNLKLFNYDIPSIELVLPIGALIMAVLGRVPVLGFILCLAFAILFFAALYKLFTIYKPVENAKTMLVISIVSILISGLMIGVYVFILRDAKPLES